MAADLGALSALARVLDSLGIHWVLVGALAANRYRLAVRMTADVDLLLADLGPGLPALRAALEADGWVVRLANPAGEILRLRHARLGAADLMTAGTDYQHEAIARARTERLGDEPVRILSPEDVIVHKLIAGRTQDVADIEAVLASGISFDEAYVERWAQFWEVADLWARLRSS